MPKLPQACCTLKQCIICSVIKYGGRLAYIFVLVIYFSSVRQQELHNPRTWPHCRSKQGCLTLHMRLCHYSEGHMLGFRMSSIVSQPMDQRSKWKMSIILCLIALCTAPFELVMPTFFSVLVQYLTILQVVNQTHVVALLGFRVRSNILTK